MRAFALAALALAACSPSIGEGAYLCGSEELCPSGQECNGADGTCVFTGTAEPFACDPSVLHEPDDTAAQGFSLGVQRCSTVPVETDGCLAAGDTANWLVFQTSANCSAIVATIRSRSPLAFEVLDVQLWDLDANSLIATSDACPDSPGVDAEQCLTGALANSGHYGIEVAPTGAGDCNGACNFNDYVVTLQVGPP